MSNPADLGVLVDEVKVIEVLFAVAILFGAIGVVAIMILIRGDKKR